MNIPNLPKNLSVETCASLLVINERQLAVFQARSEELKAVLRTTPGEKYTTNDGSTVSISKQTEDRPDGSKTVFNEAKYAELAPDIRATLEKLGVVKLEPKIIKGQAPRVTVKLA